MARFSLAKYIDAPPALVFDLFTDFEHASEHLSGVTHMDILTPGPLGVGTRLRRSQRTHHHEATTDMEITAFEPGTHYDLRSRSGGIEYRSTYRFSPEGPGTRVEVDVESEPLSFAAKLMSPLTHTMAAAMKRAIAADLDDLRRHAEQRMAHA